MNTTYSSSQIRAYILILIRIIKSDLRGLLRHIHILEESTVHIVSLLLDRCAKLEEVIWNGLVGSTENVDEGARVGFILNSEQSNCLASFACAAGSANSVDVVLNGKGELCGIS